jgi:hypothetical protein
MDAYTVEEKSTAVESLRKMEEILEDHQDHS